MFNIALEDNQNFVLCYCPTLEIAQKRLEDIKTTDLELQKYYNWEKLPKYKIIEEKKTKNNDDDITNFKLKNKIETLRNKYRNKYYKCLEDIEQLKIGNDYRDYLQAQREVIFDIYCELEKILILSRLEERKKENE